MRLRRMGLFAVSVLLTLLSCTAPRELGDECIFNDDCASPLVCASRRCRVQCRDSRDCTSGWQCTRSDDPGKRVCVPPALCVYNSDCASPLVCARDGVCRETCRSDRDCTIYGPQARCVEGGCLAPGVDAGGVDDGSADAAGDRPSAPTDGEVADVLATPVDRPAIVDTPTIVDAPTADVSAMADGPDGGGSETGIDGSTPADIGPDAAADGSLDAMDGCAAGQRTCGGACVDLASDARNCGRCGATCPEGRTCAAGQCVVPCGTATCGTAQVCSTLACAASCAAGLSDCGGTCQDLSSEDRHCGACGNACAAGQACSRSRCCPEGQATCGGRCTSVLSDPAHCGECDRACALPANAAQTTCTGGNCGFVCNTRYGDCDRVAANGCETNVQTSPDHCGRCGRACATGEGCVLGECVGVTSVATGGGHVCAVLTTGALRCWGNNQSGQLGIGSQTGDYRAVAPVTVARLSGPVMELAVGGSSSCVRLADRTVQCWGSNYLGLLGTGSSDPYGLYPATVTGLAGVSTQLSMGGSHNCVLLSGGTVQCWGRNDYGQLGDGTTTHRSTPVTVSMLGGVATQIAVNESSTCALLEGGSVRCWGYNQNGLVGDGTMTNRSLPTSVVSLGGPAREVRVGSDFACAVMEAGPVRCWGANYYGQLGNGLFDSGSLTPVTASTVSGTVAQLRLGSSHACVRLMDGQVRCWGRNAFGELGDRTTTDSAIPVTPVGLPVGVVQLSVNAWSNCARFANHQIWCWGNNSPVAQATNVFP